MAIIIWFLLLTASVIGRSCGSLFPGKRGVIEKMEVCQSKECEARGKMILSFVNEDGNPCEDFYEYACGKHLQSRTEERLKDEYSRLQDETTKKLHEIVLNYPNITEAQNFTEKVIMMHQICMYSNLTEQQEIEAIKRILALEGYGAWPLLGTEETVKQQFENITNLLRGSSLLHLFKLNVQADPFKMSSNTISVDIHKQELYPVGLNLSGISQNCTHHKRALELLLKGTTRRFRPNAMNQDLLSLARKALRIQAKLDEISKIPHQVRKLRINETEAYIPSFPVGHLLNDYIKDINMTLPYDYQVLFLNLEALNETWQFLKSEDVNSIYNYVGLQRAVKLLYFSSTMFRQETAFIYKEHQINTPEYSHARECMNIVKKVPTILTKLYTVKNFDFETKVAARSLLNTIGRQYYTNLRFNSWMDQPTRLSAIDKLKQMKPVVGYSDTLMNETDLESSFYLGNNFNINSSIATLFFWLEKDLAKINLLKLKNITPFIDETQYEIPNAYYFTKENKMVIPAGVLRGILFNTLLPSYINLGAIGFIVGHEITHGFDSKGRYYNGRGLKTNWWTNYTREKFDDKARCFLEQYSSIVEPLTKKRLIGKRILMESIADQGGIGIAFKAYRELEQKTPDIAIQGLEHFSPEQLFFISFAMPFCSRNKKNYIDLLVSFGKHALNKYRVNVPLKNMEEFSAAFHCKKGSAMRLSDHERCTLW